MKTFSFFKNQSLTTAPFNETLLDFWKQYRITLAILKIYCVEAISSYSFMSKDNKLITIKATADQPIFAYLNEGWAKIYKPFSLEKMYRFMILGTRPTDYIFGYLQLPPSGDTLLICAGEKDTLVAAAMGFPAISPHSESATGNITAEIIADLKKRFLKIVIIFDTDKTGVKSAHSLASKYGVFVATLPEMADGKDLADYIKAGYSKEDVQKLVESAVLCEAIQPTNTTNKSESESTIKAKFEKKIDDQTIIDVEDCVNQIVEQKINLTEDNYKKYIDIGFSLAQLGEKGRNFFHTVCSQSAKYNQLQEDKTFSDLLNRFTENGITIATFFKYCQDGKIKPNRFSINPIEEKETLKKTFHEIILFLQSKYEFLFNVITGKIEYKKLGSSNAFVPVDDYDQNSILFECWENNISISSATLNSIIYSKFSKKHNPFKEYFGGLPQWDQHDYIADLAATVNTTKNDLWYRCLKKWIVAIIASALADKTVNDTLIVLSGWQGQGKTRWLTTLVPDKLKQYYYCGSVNPDNKDYQIHLAECILIIMDELEDMNKREIGSLKAFITLPVVRLRRPFMRHQETLPHRASFAASVNDEMFLRDPTGSRRFLCFECIEINYQHSIPIDKVYSQALQLLNSGFQYWFNKKEIDEIHSNNERYTLKTHEEELLLEKYEPIAASKAEIFMSATQIAEVITDKGKGSINNTFINNLGKALKKNGFDRKKKGEAYKYALKLRSMANDSIFDVQSGRMTIGEPTIETHEATEEFKPFDEDFELNKKNTEL